MAAISLLERGLRTAPHPDTIRQLTRALGLQSGALGATPSGRGARMPARGGTPSAPAPGALPQRLTSWVGRSSEISDIARLVQQHRLVTLTGAGGVGKTRSALRVANEIGSLWRDGAYFVDIGTLRDGTLVAGTIAAAMSFGLLSSDAPLAALGALEHRHALIVIDNCEHLVTDVAANINAILTCSPRSAVLATSRQPLGVDGEVRYRMPSLGLPPAEGTRRLRAEEAARYDAVALFVERARETDAHFRLTDANAPFVAGICLHVDGIAWAIELAAARVGVLSPRELHERLRHRFDLLVDKHSGRLHRHETVDTMINWSYNQLDEHERLVFRQLGIFTGGWTLEAAEMVCGGEPPGSPPVFDVLAALIDKSLVETSRAGTEMRYRLLEMARDFALQLLERGGERTTLAARHATWVAHLAGRFAVAAMEGPLHEIMPIVENEIGNIRAALDWALSTADSALTARIAGNLNAFWTHRLKSEGLGYVRAALNRVDEGAPEASLLLRALASLTNASTRADAADRLIAAAEKYGTTGDLAYGYHHRAYALLELGRYDEAERAVDRAIRTHPGRDAMSLSYVKVLGTRASILTQVPGREGEARSLYREVIARMLALGEETGVVFTRSNLAALEFDAGEVKTAVSIAEEALLTARDLGLPYESTVLNDLSQYYIVLDDIDPARVNCRRSLEIARVHGESSTPYLLTSALILTLLGKPQTAATLMGFVLESCGKSGFRANLVATQRIWDMLTASLREQLDAEKVNDLRAAGAMLSEYQAVELALEAL